MLDAIKEEHSQGYNSHNLSSSDPPTEDEFSHTRLLLNPDFIAEHIRIQARLDQNKNRCFVCTACCTLVIIVICFSIKNNSGVEPSP